MNEDFVDFVAFVHPSFESEQEISIGTPVERFEG
jgi:hypothetical protein